jgi:hypothetical protein
MSKLIFTSQDFLSLFNLPKPTFEQFCDQIQILDISDTSGTFRTRQDLKSFIDRVSKKDNRKQRLSEFQTKLYQILVTDAEKSLITWFNSQAALLENINYYFDIPYENSFDGSVFSGRVNAKYGRICKNINFVNYFNTKKWYSNDSEYVFGLLKVMMEQFRLRNSLVGPAFFDQICRYNGDSRDFWRAFMMGANRPSTFNPATYKSILDHLFTGETVFAPVMGWNAYQIAFYSSNFSKFISTDVIPSVVNNGRLLDQEYTSYQEKSHLELPNKEIDLYLCPSEQLDQRYNFIDRYRDQVDAVLFSPPYFDLEIYDSEDQSFSSFPNYHDWLEGYWAETVKLCFAVMKPGARFGFVISNYRNAEKKMTTISQDMKSVADRFFPSSNHYQVQWSALGGSRQAKKTRNGNFEDLWLFEKINR